MNRHLSSVLVVALVLGPFITGCGDDDQSLTATELRKQANALCAQGNADIGAAAGPVFGSDAPTPDQLQEALDAIVSISRRQLDDIEALAAPKSLADEVDTMLAEGRAATDVAAAQGLGFFESDDDPWARTGELALALGLDACSGG